MLLLEKKKKYIGKLIDIKFNNNIIKIILLETKRSIRILSVWFNALNNGKYIINQIKEEINNCNRLIIKNKRTYSISI